MPDHIGIVACSAEGAALCYRTICVEGAQLLGAHAHPQVSMHTHPLAEYMNCIYRDDWPGVGELMLSSANKLANIGAAFLICPALTGLAQDKFTINGYIRDSSNGEALIGATVYIREIKSGATTNEYGFYSNVNPQVDHPRWSQATERRIGEFGRRDTLMFNGYADQVASLYDGMDLRKNF